MALQNNYSVQQRVGIAGLIAEPNSPFRMESGTLHVPTPGTSRNPRPGDALYYDTTENEWAIPTTAAQSLIVSGILSHRQDAVANDSGVVEFEDEAEIEVVTMGVVWLTAGSAIEYGALIAWDRSDYAWDALTTPAAFANLVDYPISCFERGGASANDIFKAAIGYGRVK